MAMMRLTRENFQRAISEARKNDDDYAPIPFRFGIPNAKEALIAGLEEVMRHKVEWLTEYDQIVNWLTDNQGKGLVLIGPPGIGKSEISMKVIPLIFRMALHKVFFTIPSNRTLQRSNISYLLASAIHCHRRFRH